MYCKLILSSKLYFKLLQTVANDFWIFSVKIHTYRMFLIIYELINEFVKVNIEFCTILVRSLNYCNQTRIKHVIYRQYRQSLAFSHYIVSKVQ